MFPYTIIRSNRKTAVLRIREGKVEFRIPHDLPQWEVDQFMHEKAPWILKTLKEQEAQAKKKEAFSIDYGSHIPLCGVLYKITKGYGWKADFDGVVFYMPRGLTPEDVKVTAINIYKSHAKAYIPDRVAVFAAQMGVVPSAIKINNAMKRWGSCTSEKNLNFSWRLIMTERSCIDYVVVHELAHLIEMNHSPRFWAVVAKILPDYKERKQKLKDFQRRLNDEDWT